MITRKQWIDFVCYLDHFSDLKPHYRGFEIQEFHRLPYDPDGSFFVDPDGPPDGSFFVTHEVIADCLRRVMYTYGGYQTWYKVNDLSHKREDKGKLEYIYNQVTFPNLKFRDLINFGK